MQRDDSEVANRTCGSVKIYQLNDCNWWVGETLEACEANYLAETGNYIDEDARELTDEEMDRLIFTDTDEDERPTGGRRTFRKQLVREIADGGGFPRMFATREF